MNFENDSDHFDQHFLIDDKIINEFVYQANLNPTDIVVEIGPGKGTISSLIAKKVKKLYCIELDQRLKPYLQKLQMNNSNVEIIYENALNIHIPSCTKIITSLPYSIIEPFINKIIKCDFKEVLMITGKKYATNVANNQLNRLSLLTNCYFKAEKIMDIVPESFNPYPHTMSSMIRLIPSNINELDFNKHFFRYMFYFKNKNIKNALVESLIRTFEDDGILVTQKESKKIIQEIEPNSEIYNKKFETCSNQEIEIINKLIDRIEEYDKNRFRSNEERTL